MDIYTRRRRSEIMSLIHGKETKIEIIVRKYLYGRGIRYRVRSKVIKTKPDIVIKKYKIAVFVNG